MAEEEQITERIDAGERAGGRHILKEVMAAVSMASCCYTFVHES